MKMRILQLTVLAALIIGTVDSFAADYATTVLSDNPVVYYRFNGADGGNSIALDECANYNGTFYGVQHGNSIAGPNLPGLGSDNFAAFFDGGDDHYVDATTLGNLGSNMANGFTFEAWINTTSTSNKMIFGVENVDDGTMMVSLQDNTEPYYGNLQDYVLLHCSDNSSTPKEIVQSDYGVHTDGEWHHLVVSTNPSDGTAKVFFDAVQSSPGIIFNEPYANYADFLTGLALGAKAQNSSGGNDIVDEWTGTMDEVAIYNGTLTQCQVCDHYHAAILEAGEIEPDSVYAAAVLADSPILYYQFDNPSGVDSNVIDTIGLNTGTYYGVEHGSTIAGPNTGGFAQNNYAAYFDGSDDHYIDATTIGTLGPCMTNGFTWEAWVKTTSTSQGAFFGMENVDGGSFMLLYMDHTGQWGENWANYTRMHFRDNGWWPNEKHIQQSHYGVHNDGQWHHLALCVDPVAGTAKAYFDGVESAPGINLNDPFTSYANFLTGLALGARARNGSLNDIIDEWTGTMDEVAIYNRVLTGTEILNHFQASTGFPPVAEAGGPYVIRNGETINLFGCGSYDENGTIVDYSWDIDGDSVGDVTGENPAVSYSYLVSSLGLTPDRDNPYAVTLTVIDNDGVEDTETTEITIIDENISGIYVEAILDIPAPPPGETANFRDINPNDFDLDFDVKVSAETVAEDDIAEFTFHEIFTDQNFTCAKVLGNEECGGIFSVSLDETDISLIPGAYHIRVDINDGAAFLTDNFPGSAWLYVRKADEPDMVANASFHLAYTAVTLLASPHNVYLDLLKNQWVNDIPIAAPLPATLNPLDGSNYQLWLDNMVDCWWEGVGDPLMHPEAMHDGGMGYLAGARMYRFLEMEDRVVFCENILKRICTLLDRTDGDGNIGYWIVRSATLLEYGGYNANEDSYLLSFIARVASHFYLTGGSAGQAYATQLMNKLLPILNARLANGHIGVESTVWLENPGSRMYDGRQTAAFTEYERTSYIMGNYPTTLTASIVPHVNEMAVLCVDGNGFYGLETDEHDAGEGTMHCMEALLPMYEALSSLDSVQYPALTQNLPTIANACQDGVQWMTYQPWGLWVVWASGEIEMVLSDYIRLFNNDPNLIDYQSYRQDTPSYHMDSDERFVHRFGGKGVCSPFLTLSVDELLPEDTNFDKYVNFKDLANIAGDWMKCNNPEDTNCVW